MKEKLIAKLISVLIERAVAMLTPEKVKELTDKFLDVIEDLVQKSANKYDDVMVLPLCAKIREMADIPDNDEEES